MVFLSFSSGKALQSVKEQIKEQSRIINTVSITCFSLPILHPIIGEVILQKQMKLLQSTVQYRPQSFLQGEFSQKARET